MCVILKLTKLEAEQLTVWATKAVGKYRGYRFGQALWDEIPLPLLHQYQHPEFLGYPEDVDFFYEKDNTVALEKFYKYFVEE